MSIDIQEIFSLKHLNILLTGSSGFLGTALKKALSEYRIVTIGRKNADINVNLTEANNKLPHSNIIIHAAGRAHFTPKNKKEKEEFYNYNLSITQNLLSSLQNSKSPAYFIFISSVSVYGINNGININENAVLQATDAYGKSKIESELIIKEWCKKNHVVCTILRLPLVVGCNPPGNLGAMINSIKKGYYFNIEGGNVQKSMVLAEDVAKFILQAAEVGGTYNLTDGRHPKFAELSKHIAYQCGKSYIPNVPLWFAKFLASIGDIVGDCFPINSNKLAKITSPLTFDDSKARAAFGWDPTPVLKGFKLNENDQ